jgi:hypothetical protein
MKSLASLVASHHERCDAWWIVASYRKCVLVVDSWCRPPLFVTTLRTGVVQQRMQEAWNRVRWLQREEIAHA